MRKSAVAFNNNAADTAPCISGANVRTHQIDFRRNFVFSAHDHAIAAERHVRVCPRGRVEVVERIIEVCTERRLIRRVDARHLDRADNVLPDCEIIIGVSVFCLRRERVCVFSLFHQAHQSHHHMVRRTVAVILRTRSINQTAAIFRRVVLGGVRQLQSITHKSPVLEIIPCLVVKLIFQPVDNALAVCIRVAEPRRVVVQAVFQLPRCEVAVCKVGVALMQRCPRILVEVAFVVGSHDHVELMSGAVAEMQIALHTFRKSRQIIVPGHDRVVICDPVLHTGHEVAVITQRFECAPRGICHRYVRRNRPDRDRVRAGKCDFQTAFNIIRKDDRGRIDLAGGKIEIIAPARELEHDDLVGSAGGRDLAERLVEVRHDTGTAVICSLD